MSGTDAHRSTVGRPRSQNKNGGTAGLGGAINHAEKSEERGLPGFY